MSYNHLPRHLKTCFTYCALFPKDHGFYKEKLLVQMWMAHDLIQKQEQQRPEDVGAQYFEELVNASLFQCVDGKYVMHDLIHDLALLVSNGEFATANSSLTNDQIETVRNLTIGRGEYSKVPRLCKMEKLLTLYTIWSYENYRNDPVLDFFNQLKSIRVLVLGSSNVIDIPDCISELRHLRYLDVSQTRVKRLPDSFCHLYNLQMLAAPSVYLPKDIVNISSLRYVRARLSTCKGVGKLTSLQELSSIYVREGDNITELGDMQILPGKLRIEGLENVSTLEGDAGALMEKQTYMDELELKFDEQLEKSTISEKVLDSLGCPPNLMYLGIAGYNGLKPPSWMVDGKHKFHKLQTLVLDSCSKLESLPPHGKFANFMASLSRLEIRDCESLRSVSIDIHGLDSLERLIFMDCPILELAFEDGSSSSSSSGNSVADLIHYISIDSTQVFRTLLHYEIVSLETLFIANLGGFENFDETEANNFCKSRSLKSLKILECEDLKSLPADFHKLSSLEELSIDWCLKLQSLPLDFHKLSSLKDLNLYHCSQLQSLPPDFHKLSSLENLRLFDCSQLQSLPPDFHKLSSLEVLCIFRCSQLHSLPVDGFSPSLRFVSIESCPLLYERCKDEFGLDWHKINHIPERHIEPW